MKYFSNITSVLLTVLVAYLLFKQAPTIINSYKQQGSPIEPLQVLDLAGMPVNLPLADKKVYLFWATWCPPCHLQMDMFQSAVESKEIKANDIVAVSLGEPLTTVKEHLRKNKISYTVLANPSGKAWRAFNIKATPTIVFVNSEGIINYYTAGLAPMAVYRAMKFLNNK